MARPKNEDLKTRIREARAAGSSIDALMTSFGLSRNTVFYHLREDVTRDGREKYTAEERARIALMTDEELEIEARRLGRSFVALQRVAYRERKHQRENHDVQARAKIELRGYVDFGMESELRLVGLSQDLLSLANKRLSVYRLRLTAPNRLETLDGRKFCLLRLGFQKALLVDTIETLKANAGRIKSSWRTNPCPACGSTSLGLRSRVDGSTYRVCPCGWSEDTGRVEQVKEERRQGYRSKSE